MAARQKGTPSDRQLSENQPTVARSDKVGSRTRGDDMRKAKFKDRDPQRITLDKNAINAAIDAANEATAAGLDAQEQLEHGIRAYLHAWASEDSDIEFAISFGNE